MNFKTTIIKIEGKNFDVFFQNLITNDIKLLENNQALYSLMLSPQGKFLHDFIIVKEKDFFFLEVNEHEIEDLVKLIKKYDLRNNFTISEEKNLSTYFILYENAPKNILGNLNICKVFKNENYTIFSDPRKENFLLRLWIRKETIKSEPEILSKTLSSNELNLERIKKTLPDSLLDLEKNKSFVLNYNFNTLSAISFTKGCYIGQENTSRQNYRGKIKYGLKTLKLLNGDVPQFNETLFVNNQKVGIMKSSSENYGLALIRIDFSGSHDKLSLDNSKTKMQLI